MARDEKTGKFVSTKQTQTMTDAQREAICYRSKLLDKYFDTYEELVAAEEEARKAEEAKRLAAEAKKAEASKVEEAFKALNAAKKAYNETSIKAEQAYLAELQLAKKKYLEAVAAVRETLNLAEKQYDAALVAFQKAHPEGYHTTLRDGDNVAVLSRNTGASVGDWAKFFNALEELF